MIFFSFVHELHCYSVRKGLVNYGFLPFELPKREAVRMSRMVAELLTLARADAGQEIAFEVVDLHEIVLEVSYEIHKWNSLIKIECELDHQTLCV